MKKILLIKKTAAYLFLAAYLAFFITNISHYHTYSLLNAHSIENQKPHDKATQHFLTNDSSFCLVNYFSHSILDFKFSSKNIKIFFSKPEKLVLNTKNELPQNFLLANNLYRAPPLVFS